MVNYLYIDITIDKVNFSLDLEVYFPVAREHINVQTDIYLRE